MLVSPIAGRAEAKRRSKDFFTSDNDKYSGPQARGRNRRKRDKQYTCYTARLVYPVSPHSTYARMAIAEKKNTCVLATNQHTQI